MVVVEEVGIITCEKGVLGQKARLLIRGSAQRVQLRTDTQKNEVKDQEDEIEDGRDKCEERVEERSNTQTHYTWMV